MKSFVHLELRSWIRRNEVCPIVVGNDIYLCTDLLHALSLWRPVSHKLTFLLLFFISLSIAYFLSSKIASVSDFAISVLSVVAFSF